MAYKKSDSIADLAEALTNFQKSIPVIPKDKTAKINSSKGSYSYKYADLGSIWDKIRGPLADNGLSVLQSPTTLQSDPALTTIVMHKSGQWIEDTMQLKIMQDSPQGQGSAITYARRYMLSAMLGIVTDDDTDAQEHQAISNIQKQQLRNAALKVVPELQGDPIAMVRFLSEVTGKHPSRLTVDEFDDAIQAVVMYTSKLMEEE